MKILGNSGYEIDVVHTLPAIVAVNFAIAAVLYAAGLNTLWCTVISSQCIGLSIYAFTCAAMHWSPSPARFLWTLPLTLLGGTLTGIAIALLLGGPEMLGLHHGALPWRALTFGLFFGGLLSYLFFLHAKAVGNAAEMEKEKAKNLAIEKQIAEARLQTLQAQIEPHFLFNTLANVQSLIDLDPARAQRILDSFIHYLRATLARTRDTAATLGAECELLEAYLSIIAIRMGARLRYRIDVPAALRQQPLPPMLLQPLVENAIKHGLEPKIDGGTVAIGAATGNGKLRVTITDDGLGFQGGNGVGLGNVRARLAALYGDAARLHLEDNTPAGTRAIVELPLPEPRETDAAAADITPHGALLGEPVLGTPE